MASEPHKVTEHKKPTPSERQLDEGGSTIAYLADDVPIGEVIEDVWDGLPNRAVRVVCEWYKLRWTTPEELADPDFLYDQFGDHEQNGVDTSVIYTRVEDDEPDTHLYVRLELVPADHDELLDALQEALAYVPEFFIEKHDMLVPLRRHGRVES